MKNKMIVGALASLLLLGGAAIAGASQYDSRSDDSKSRVSDDRNGQKVEIETEHGKTYVKVETDDNSQSQSSSSNGITAEQAVEIALRTVNGTVKEIEQEIEHGRLEYKIEIKTKNGEAKVRIDAETGKVVRIDSDDDSKSDDGSHRHSGDDDNKAGDGAHQNRHSGDDDNKAGDGAHQNRHSGDDDNKADDDN